MVDFHKSGSIIILSERMVFVMDAAKNIIPIVATLVILSLIWQLISFLGQRSIFINFLTNKLMSLFQGLKK